MESVFLKSFPSNSKGTPSKEDSSPVCNRVHLMECRVHLCPGHMCGSDTVIGAWNKSENQEDKIPALVELIL